MGLFSKIKELTTKKQHPMIGNKLTGAEVFKTICTFCSCGCGMLAYVKDGKLKSLEGDYDNPINEGTLCSKGAAAAELHRSQERITMPLYRAPGSSFWEKKSWDWIIERIARKFKTIRDESWIKQEHTPSGEFTANRSDAIAFLGGAINTNEEAYLYKKLATLLGLYYIEHQARI